MESFSAAFREGMAARARLLGDTGAGAPDQWENQLGSRDMQDDVHAMISIYGKTTLDIDACQETMLPPGAAGISILFAQQAQQLRGKREHFGFRDGVSKPRIAGMAPPDISGGGLPTHTGQVSPIAPGEFILGYPGQGGIDHAHPVPPFHKNGTYIVYRKLQQHVGLFRNYVAAEPMCWHQESGPCGNSPNRRPGPNDEDCMSSFLSQFDALDPAGQAALTQKWLVEKPFPLFAELRANRPILVTPVGVLVSRFDDVHNLLGMIVGIIDTTSKAAAYAIDWLLDHLEARRQADEAIRSGDDRLLTNCVLEAMRFKPQKHGPASALRSGNGFGRNQSVAHRRPAWHARRRRHLFRHV